MKVGNTNRRLLRSPKYAALGHFADDKRECTTYNARGEPLLCVLRRSRCLCGLLKVPKTTTEKATKH